MAALQANVACYPLIATGPSGATFNRVAANRLHVAGGASIPDIDDPARHRLNIFTSTITSAALNAAGNYNADTNIEFKKSNVSRRGDGYANDDHLPKCVQNRSAISKCGYTKKQVQASDKSKKRSSDDDWLKGAVPLTSVLGKKKRNIDNDDNDNVSNIGI